MTANDVNTFNILHRISSVRLYHLDTKQTKSYQQIKDDPYCLINAFEHSTRL